MEHGIQTCPRRLGELGPWEHATGLDRWRDDDTCSFCGSLHPARFLEFAIEGMELVPTDKSYKVYVRPGNRPQQKFYFQHPSLAERRIFIGLLNGGTLCFASPGGFYVLPFFAQSAQKGKEIQ